MRELPIAARLYVLVIGLAGWTILAVMGRFIFSGDDVHGSQLLMLLSFVALTILGELQLIQAPLGAEGVDLTFSTAFAFALLIGFGAPYAAIASAIASLAADIIGRKAWWKALFNAGQFVLVSFAAGSVFEVVAGESHLNLPTAFSHPIELVAATAAALTYFAVNTVMLSTALALAQRIPIMGLIKEESGYQLMGSLGMFGLAPIAIVATYRSVWLLPILLIPLVVSYRSTRVSVEKEHQALHDSLTGLPNRTMFRLKVIAAIERPDPPDSFTAVMLMDLNRFKEINDTLGHGTGDRVLQALGPRLLAAVGGDHTIARLGGDEFGVVLPGLVDTATAEDAARRVLDSVREPIEIDGLDLEVGASVGIAIQGRHGDDADALIQHADVAMYSAKDNGGGFTVYSSMLDDTSPMQLGLVAALRQSIEQGGLVVHYQPKVSVDTGLVAGAEALVRWEHPVRGIVHPDDFIPVAEQSGLIRELTHLVLTEAIAANARWRRQGFDVSISVNISARSLHDLDLPAVVGALIEVEGVPPSCVVLEITETTIMANPAQAIGELERLRAIGVELSMDDYGTGHSSLSQMKTLPIDEVKIDKSFITYMREDSRDSLIAASTIDLARGLGFRVVAEGVETPEAWALLQRMGCDLGQGYFFTRPLPEAQFVEWMADNDRRRRAAFGGERSESASAIATDASPVG